MKLTLKEKAKLFWDRNKADIIGWLIGAGVITGVGCAAAYASKKAAEKREAELAEQIRKLNEEVAKQQAEAEAEEERIKNNPENQIAGGYFRPNNDNLCDAEYPNIVVNAVPIANMGELGQEVLNKLNEEWIGKNGVENPFNPETAVADVIVDFGHEVWKHNHPEESESQEKQSA